MSRALGEVGRHLSWEAPGSFLYRSRGKGKPGTILLEVAAAPFGTCLQVLGRSRLLRLVVVGRLVRVAGVLPHADDVALDPLDRLCARRVQTLGRRFPADEILLASLRRLGVAITWIGRSPPTSGNRNRLRDAVRGLASGRSSATPFVAFAGANLALLLIGLLITVVVALIVWLTGLM